MTTTDLGAAVEMISRPKSTLGDALRAEQCAENAFAAAGHHVSRRAYMDAMKAAWKAYDDCVEEIADALAAQAQPTAWLIERDGQYFAPIHSEWTVKQALDPGLWKENWSADANKALRFSRQSDAQALIAHEGWRRAVATEHMWIAAQAQPAQPSPGLLSPANQDTFRMVRAFGAALADKLARAELKYGYSNGWLTEDWERECVSQLRLHADKGDPLDVAAYAAFCWARGWSTAQPVQQAEGWHRLTCEVAQMATDWRYGDLEGVSDGAIAIIKRQSETFAKRVVAAMIAASPAAPEAAPEPVSMGEIARIIASFDLGRRDRMHGGGWLVRGPGMKDRGATIFHDEEEAWAALSQTQAQAVLKYLEGRRG